MTYIFRGAWNVLCSSGHEGSILWYAASDSAVGTTDGRQLDFKNPFPSHVSVIQSPADPASPVPAP